MTRNELLENLNEMEHKKKLKFLKEIYFSL